MQFTFLLPFLLLLKEIKGSHLVILLLLGFHIIYTPMILRITQQMFSSVQKGIVMFILDFLLIINLQSAGQLMVLLVLNISQMALSSNPMQV